MGLQVDTPVGRSREDRTDNAERQAWEAAAALEGVRLEVMRGAEPTDYLRRHLQVARTWLDQIEQEINGRQHDRAA